MLVSSAASVEYSTFDVDGSSVVHVMFTRELSTMADLIAVTTGGVVSVAPMRISSGRRDSSR